MSIDEIRKLHYKQEGIEERIEKNLMDLKGKINFDNEYDYKTMREGK